MPRRVLLVDDDQAILGSLGEALADMGLVVETVSSAEQALGLLSGFAPDLLLSDIRMPGLDGIELLELVRERAPRVDVVLMTAYDDMPTVVRAMRAGALDFLVKPIQLDELETVLGRAAKDRATRERATREAEDDARSYRVGELVGHDRAMIEVFKMVGKLASSRVSVLIRGESGTGKELVAHAIHASSARRFGPLVVVNCGALAEGILESELFGHERGSFTGAHKQHKGKFELADGGTIFLDEIGAVSQRVQVELLRVLEDKVVNRLGGKSPIAVDFRVIAATNQDLESLIQSGDFREDLFWRLNVFTIDIPPLRLRPEDTVLLAEHFLDRLAKAMIRKPMALSNEAIQAIEDYSWPGNVRELQNAIERAVVLSSPPTVEIKDLPLRVTRVAHRQGPLSLAEIERVHIISILNGNNWNISQTAQILEVDRGTLYNKLEKYGLSRPGADT